MFKEERLEQIVNVVDQQKTVLTEDLAKQLGVSIATIRRDITELVNLGKIGRAHGGVMSIQNKDSVVEPTYSAKGRMNTKEKKRIAAYAAGLIENGDIIVLDSGSTCLEVARAIKNKHDLAVITNDLLVALEFATNKNHNNVIMAGGFLRSDYYSTYGNFCEEMLQHIRAKKIMLGVDSVDVNLGLMSYSPDDVKVKQILLDISEEITLVCDHTKFGAAAYIFIAPLTKVSRIITGKELSDDIYEELVASGIEVVRV